MSFIIAIIVLSILKLTFTIGRFIAAKQLKLPVEKFVVGIDWGKPIFSKRFNETEFVIYPIFWGGYIEYNKNFDPEVKCSNKQKAILTSSSLFAMLISIILIGLVYINYVPTGTYETIITKTTENTPLKTGDKIINVNGIDVKGKNTFNTILQKNRYKDGQVSEELIDYYKKEIQKLNKDKIKDGEIAANTEIILPAEITEGKISRYLSEENIKLDKQQILLRDSIKDRKVFIGEQTPLHDIATAVADTGYDVIITVNRAGETVTLAPISPDEFGNINSQYEVKTIYRAKSDVLKSIKESLKFKIEPKTFGKNVLSIIAMLALISILVLVHEAGHYLAARMFKIKVEKFGFGLPFGPILWQKQCGETLVVIHAFLLGGYVSFPDDDKNNDLPKDSPDRFVNKPIYQRLVVVSAGVIANVLCAIFIVTLTAMLWGKLPTEDYQTYIKKLAPEAQKNISVMQSGLKEGDKVVEMNGSPIDSSYAFQIFAIKSKKFDGMVSPQLVKKNLESLQHLNPKYRSSELIPQGTVIKLPKELQEAEVKLTDEMLRGYERIVDDKVAITEGQKALRDQLQNKKKYISDGTITLNDIAFAISDNACPMFLKVEREGEIIELPAIYSNENGIIGVELDKKRIFVETKNIKTALIESWNYLYSQTKMLLKGLWQLFTGKVPLENMHGVVAVVKYGGDVIQQDGFFQGLLLTALISLDLAIVNFLPIPALDGGHVMFLLIEKIYGKPLDEETVNSIATAGFMFLILLMVIVLYNDIVALAMHKI